MMGKLSRVVVQAMLPLQAAILACTIMLARSPAALGFASDGRKCRCFMCVCDFDPHPLPPELPVHHYPPPAEPEHHPSPPPPPPALPEPHYYPPPVEHEPVPGEYHYYPPPAYGYYPSVGLPYYPPAGDMYPRDKASSKSGAHRQRGPTRLLLAVVVVLASAALSSSLLQAPSAYYC